VAESRQKSRRRTVRTSPNQRFLASRSVEKYQAKSPRIRSPKKKVRRGVMTLRSVGEELKTEFRLRMFFMENP
jgi:hypothetical protein